MNSRPSVSAVLRPHHGEQRGLAQGVEGQREQRADRHHRERPRGAAEPRQQALDQPSAQADQRHRRIGRRLHQGTQVDDADGGEKADRDPGPERLEPSGRRPARPEKAGEGGDRDDDDPVAEREQRAAVACPGLATARTHPRQAVDGRQMVGIETVAHAEQEDERAQCAEVGGQVGHRDPDGG
jgi:hypothetical protein